KQVSFQVFQRVLSYLVSKGWPAPVSLDSGNGYHAYWSVDLPNDDVSAQLVSSFLSVIRIRFGPLIDASVSDARRLGRVPGTWNRKGEPTSERPHRPCKFLDLPDLACVVTAAMIRDVVTEINQEHATCADLGLNGDKRHGVRPGDDFNNRSSWAEIL